MTKTIYKYDAPPSDVVWIAMPKGAEILTVQTQYGNPVIWAIVDPDSPKEVRRFVVRGTGHKLGKVGRYIGTVQMMSGRLVFHYFEVEHA